MANAAAAESVACLRGHSFHPSFHGLRHRLCVGGPALRGSSAESSYSRPSAVTCVTYSPDFAQMEVPGVAGQDDDACRLIGLHLVAVEPIAEPDIEDARHDR